MRKKFTILLCILFIVPRMCAWNFWTEDGYPATSTVHSVQLRTGAEFTKDFGKGVKLNFGEDLRFDVHNSTTGASFSKSYTTLALSYAPIKNLKLDAGYTMKILGADSTWSAEKKADYNEWLRHRVFFSVTGSYKFERVKVSLRERAMCEMRTDSVNPDEKAQNAWMLRSKAAVEYTCFAKPLKPYVWVEVVNTLNAPEYQRMYKDNNTANRGMQYINRVRTAVGVVWKIDKSNALDFYYRFNYGYDRDININSKYYTAGKALKVRLTEERSFQHAIGVAYNLDW